MPDITVRGVTLCAAARQTPKVIVPVMADTLPAAKDQAAALAALPAAELVELRLDPLPAADRTAALAAVRGALRADQPLLLTLRTKREGGLADLDPAAYAAAVKDLLAGPVRPDLVDIEFSAGPERVGELLNIAHAAGVRTVLSEHHFDGTPPQDEMTASLCAMVDAGADVAKLAVMPMKAGDAAALLAATAAAAAAPAHHHGDGDPGRTHPRGGRGLRQLRDLRRRGACQRPRPARRRHTFSSPTGFRELFIK